jgi:CubicO group peptidase (beta-lactamase class C family)
MVERGGQPGFGCSFRVVATVPFDRTPIADPSELGVDPDALAAFRTRVQQGIDDGTTPSCQYAFARDGKIAVFETIGAAAPASRYVIFSATKAVVAGAVWILMGEGQIDVGRRVAEMIPEFGSNGKEDITIEQVLLHTSGFPRAPFSPLDWDDRDKRLARFAKWRTNWAPGTRFEYHPTSAHWVLAELIERATGTDFRAFVRAQIIGPLGISGFELGVPPERGGDINELVAAGSPATPEELQAVLGISKLPVTEVTTEALLQFNQPAVRAVGVPGGGGVSTAADLALYYQALLHDPGRIWKPEVLADVTSQVRNTYPDYIGVPANRTRGLVVAGDDGRAGARGMGKTVSPRAFGHNGAGGQIAWADPETGLSFCYLTNGLDQHQLREWRRTTAIASRAANCVRRSKESDSVR